MSFIDQYMPDGVPGYPCASVPRTKTSIQVTSGGREQRNQEWEHPLRRFILPEAAGRQWAVVEALTHHWLITAGPARSFPWQDPLDKASCNLRAPNEPDAETLARIKATDQPLGTGTGFTQSFQLTKTYTVGPLTYTRTIHLPVTASVVVAIDGDVVDPADYSVSRPGGIVTFDVAPDDGAVITAGFLFDCEVRFESDEQLEAILRTYQVGAFADITLIEVRPC